jgi:hypothetical protein
MSTYGTATPLDRAYDYYIRVKIEGVDCYSVGCDTQLEAERLADVIDQADDVQETEVVSP